MEDDYKSKLIIPIVMEGDSKVEHDNEWRTYREINPQLEKQHGKAFSIIRGQCMQVLIYHMKHDPYWYKKIE